MDFRLEVVCILFASMLAHGNLFARALTSCSSDQVGGTCQSMAIAKVFSNQQQLQNPTDSPTFENTCSKCDPGRCSMQQNTSLSLATDLSVSVFPSNHRRNWYNMLIQWNNSLTTFPVDRYKVCIWIGDMLSAISCTGSNVDHMFFTKINKYRRHDTWIRVEVKAIQAAKIIDCVSTEIKLDSLPPLPAVCGQAFAYNDYCSKRMLHSLINDSLVKAETVMDPSPGPSEYMDLHLSWLPNEAPSVVVALTYPGQEATDCILPGREPPCFIASNTTSVTIGPLNISTIYRVHLHGFNPSDCPSLELGHMINGCGERCCTHAVQLLMPTNTSHDQILLSASRTTVSHDQISSSASCTTPSHDQISLSAGHTVLSHDQNSLSISHTTMSHDQISSLASHTTLSHDQVSPSAGRTVLSHDQISMSAIHTTLSHDQISMSAGHTVLSHDQIPLSIKRNVAITSSLSLVVSQTPIPNLSSPIVLKSISSLGYSTDTDVVMASVIPPVVLVSCLVLSVPVIILLVSRWSKNKVKHSEHRVSLQSPPPPGHVIISECHGTSASPNYSLVESSFMKCRSQIPPPLPKESHSFPSALVLYSPKTPTKEKERILSYLIAGLNEFGINVKSPDVICIKSGISYWLEKEIKKSTVLCVCNSEMKSEWESDKPSQLIGSLRQLLHGLVTFGLSDFATVIMQTEGINDNQDYIPTDYLKGQRQFTIRDKKDIESIAHYILHVPLYTTNSPCITI